MSDHITNEDFENKFTLVVRKPQEGKTFICINNITQDRTNNIHIVLTMNTLSAGMQFFGRMEESIGPKNIIVFNSKKSTSGQCLHARHVDDVFNLIREKPQIKVVVCCAHYSKIRNKIGDLFSLATDSIHFRDKNRMFVVHIDEAHEYIPSLKNRECVRAYNDSTVVQSIIGYSATPDKIWVPNQTDLMYHKFPILDVEAELQIIRSPDYFGVGRTRIIITEDSIDSIDNDVIATVDISEIVSERVLIRSGKDADKKIALYGKKYYFSHGNEIRLLSHIDHILSKRFIDPNCFSYHFVPAYTRKVTHYCAADIILKHYPGANVIVINGNGFELLRTSRYTGKSDIVVRGDMLKARAEHSDKVEFKRLLEPSYMVRRLIEGNTNVPTFITGFTCVGMSITLIDEVIGNFDSVIMAHDHYGRDTIYQLCRFLFNYSKWSEESRAKIKETQFYSLTAIVPKICFEYESSVELMSSVYADGHARSLREIQGLDEETLTARETKKADLASLATEIKNASKIWKKVKVYDGEEQEAEAWEQVRKFYREKTGKELGKRSMPILGEDSFYRCSTTKHVDLHTTRSIASMEKQSWYSTFQLVANKLSYARIFVGYECINDPSEYTIYIKFVELEDSEKTREILSRYGNRQCTSASSSRSSKSMSVNTSNSSDEDDTSSDESFA